tara:strand:- start:35622 stop:36572 length:951 start_codon:yes stop_codon:yes gene_type:complete
LFAGVASADISPDQHGPIGVMGDHTHKQGEWMFSYRYMVMDMDGNRDGSSRLAPSEILRSGTGPYAVSPLNMTMEMHMLGMMYAPSDRYTLMAMIPWQTNKMDHATAVGGRFETESSDLGDISLAVLVPFGESSSWLVGMSAPTGDLDQRDQTPMGRAFLPYAMQIGSGTYNLQLGYTLNKQFDDYSVGAQVKGNFPLGENDEDYSVGERYELSGWFAKRIGQFSWSVRGTYLRNQNYDGADPRYAMGLATNLVPTVDPDLRGGQRFDVGVGVNWAHPSGIRLALEYQLPAYQRLDGPQLEVDNMLTVGLQYAPSR